MKETTTKIHLATEAETTALSEHFSRHLKAGESILLSGDLGTGKSSFARSFIRHRLGQDEEVPSPTFTLVQTYQHDEVEIWHCDLYRLSDPTEVIELGLDEALDREICLIEWPDRLGEIEPPAAIKIQLEYAGDGRTATHVATTERLRKIVGLYDQSR